MTPPRDENNVTALNAGEIAGKIFPVDLFHPNAGADLRNQVAAALVAYGEACVEEQRNRDHLPDGPCCHALKRADAEGYRRGIKQASDLAFLHSCDDDCDVDYPGNGGGCASQIRDAIRNLSKEA